MKKKLLSIYTWWVMAVLVLVTYIIVLIFSRKKTKASLAEYYHISKPTLIKWMKYFQNDFDLNTWNEKRYITFLEFVRLKRIFGEDAQWVFCKRQIFEHAESDYKTVAANVKRRLNDLGISWEAWEACNVFPPSITKRILEMLG